MHIQRINRPEVAAYTSELLPVNRVVEARLEFSLRGACRGDSLRVLATTQQDVRVRGRDHRAVHRPLRTVDANHLEIVGIDELRGAVLRRSDEHRLVPVEVEAVHAVRVNLLSQHLLARLRVILDDVTRVETRDDILIGDGPPDAGGLVIVIDGDLFVGRVQRSGIVSLACGRCNCIMYSEGIL